MLCLCVINFTYPSIMFCKFRWQAITTALQGAANSRRTGEVASDGESSIEAGLVSAFRLSLP